MQPHGQHAPERIHIAELQTTGGIFIIMSPLIFFLGTKIPIRTNFQKEIQGVHVGTLLLATEMLLHLCCTSFLLLLTFWVALNESEA